jgi:hypothetical protein
MTQWSIWGGFMKKTRGQKSRATVPLKKRPWGPTGKWTNQREPHGDQQDNRPIREHHRDLQDNISKRENTTATYRITEQSENTIKIYRRVDQSERIPTGTKG